MIINLPKYLNSIDCSNNQIKKITGILKKWPKNLKKLKLGKIFSQAIMSKNLPQQLIHLSFDQCYQYYYLIH